MNHSPDENALTSVEFWQDEFWQIGDQDIPDLQIDVNDPEYRDLHRYLKQHLPAGAETRLLELGCHPGRYLWYFHTYFGFQVEGVEYVKPACQLTKDALASHEVAAKIHHGDLFTFEPEDGLYDIVFSLGVVEHFRDIRPVIRRHVDLAKPGGLVVIEVPNHAGLNGWLLKRVDQQVYEAHNRMSYRDLKRACDEIPELEFVSGGYLSRFNLSPSNFFQHMLKKWPLWFYNLVFRVYYVTLLVSRILPNTRWFSPNTILIARKKRSPESETSQ